MKMTEKMNHRKLAIITATIVLFSLIGFKASAQYDNTIYSLKSVPQTTLTNPAIMPDYKYHFGFPFLSSDYTGFGTSGARYSDALYRRDDDSMLVDIPGIISATKEKNNLNVRQVVQILNFGMQWKDWYFSASISDIADVNMMYSKDVVELIGLGNASRIGEAFDLGATALKAQYYREYALGAAYDYDNRWNFGARVKFLFGKAAIDTKNMEGKLTTTEDYYYLTTESYMTINMSLPEYKKDTTEDVTLGEMLFTSWNPGMAFDLGATYKMDDQWTFSASVLDLGWITYNRWLKTYSNDNVVWTYKGVEATQFDGMTDDQRDDRIEEIKDSLIDMFQLDESVQPFSVTLTAKIYLGANYQLSDIENVSALLRTEIFHNVWRPSLTLSYYRQLHENFGITGSYTIANRSYANFGLGLVVDAAPVQIYLVTDNIVGLVAPDKVHYANFHFGINFIFPEKSGGKTMMDL